MSFIDLDMLEPIPGDLVMARLDMRSWETDDRRGKEGIYISRGEQGLVLATWLVGNHRRIKLFRAQRIVLFSCADHCVRKNWKVVEAAPRLPTLGCP